MLSSSPDRSAGTAHDELTEGEMRGLLGYRLAKANISCSKAFEREVGDPMQLRPVEFTILQLVHANPQTSPAKLARALDITGPGVKLWLDRLEARNLVRRTQRATDRRSHRLELTASGTKVVTSALARLLAADAAVLEVLSPAEFQMLIELLAKVARTPRPATAPQPSS
jgi:DNA-binding MarR family transcriptional regulator